MRREPACSIATRPPLVVLMPSRGPVATAGTPGDLSRRSAGHGLGPPHPGPRAERRSHGLHVHPFPPSETETSEMMIVMKTTATEEDVAAVIDRIEAIGARADVSRGEEVTLIGAIGDREHEAHVADMGLEGEPGVDHVVPILKPYKLASLERRRGEPSVLDLAGVPIGGRHFALIAGPCTVESRDQTLATAEAVKAAGAPLLRGGAYKPRTSPYSFQGLGEEGLRLLAEAKERTGLPVVTELMDVRDLEPVLEVADVIQIGARNMQNYTLLTEIGRAGRPVLIKRGYSATL